MDAAAFMDDIFNTALNMTSNVKNASNALFNNGAFDDSRRNNGNNNFYAGNGNNLPNVQPCTYGYGYEDNNYNQYGYMNNNTNNNFNYSQYDGFKEPNYGISQNPSGTDSNLFSLGGLF